MTTVYIQLDAIRLAQRLEQKSTWCIEDNEMHPEMHAYKMHALYERHHKVSSSPSNHLNTNNSDKHEVIKMTNTSTNAKYMNGPFTVNSRLV